MLEQRRQSIQWKLFFTLLGASILGTLAVLPYALTPDILEQLTVPLWVLVAGQLVQSTILFSVAIFIGLMLGKKIDLGAPILEDYFDGEPLTRARVLDLLKLGIACGIAVGIAIVAVEATCFAKVAAALAENFKPAVWKGFLASFYGGIDEEVLLRLFLMTTLAWLFLKVRRSELSMWAAIVVTAILFGLGHLPMTASLVTLTPVVVGRAVILNGIAGVVFGWLYWKRGLEAAMVAHFTADIVLHVVVMAFVGARA